MKKETEWPKKQRRKGQKSFEHQPGRFRPQYFRTFSSMSSLWIGMIQFWWVWGENCGAHHFFTLSSLPTKYINYPSFLIFFLLYILSTLFSIQPNIPLFSIHPIWPSTKPESRVPWKKIWVKIIIIILLSKIVSFEFT